MATTEPKSPAGGPAEEQPKHHDYSWLSESVCREKTIAELCTHFGASEMGIKHAMTVRGIHETKDAYHKTDPSHGWALKAEMGDMSFLSEENAANHTLQQIAKHFGITPALAKYWMFSKGIKRCKDLTYDSEHGWQKSKVAEAEIRTTERTAVAMDRLINRLPASSMVTRARAAAVAVQQHEQPSPVTTRSDTRAAAGPADQGPPGTPASWASSQETPSPALPPPAPSPDWLDWASSQETPSPALPPPAPSPDWLDASPPSRRQLCDAERYGTTAKGDQP